MRFLVITLKGPMMSFGGPAIDGINKTSRLPGLSYMTGLIGNALGYHRHHYDALETLQNAITFAAREDMEGIVQDEFQTAMIRQKDKGWTRSEHEIREGGAATYNSPIIRRRPYLSDHAVTVVLGLNDIDLTLEDVAEALLRPAGCLYLGRKGFFPSSWLIHEGKPHIIEAENALEALRQAPVIFGDPSAKKKAVWPVDVDEGRRMPQHDIRDFRSGRHVGKRYQKEGRISVNIT